MGELTALLPLEAWEKKLKYQKIKMTRDPCRENLFV